MQEPYISLAIQRAGIGLPGFPSVLQVEARTRAAAVSPISQMTVDKVLS